MATTPATPVVTPQQTAFLQQLVNAVGNINAGLTVQAPPATQTQGRTQPQESGFAGGVKKQTSTEAIEKYKADHGITTGYINEGDYVGLTFDAADVDFLQQRTIDEKGIRACFDLRMEELCQAIGAMNSIKKNKTRVILVVCYGYWGRNKMDGTGINVNFALDNGQERTVDIAKELGLYTGTPNDDIARDVSVLTLSKIARIFVLEAYSARDHKVAVQSPLRIKCSWKNESHKKYIQIQGALLALRYKRDKTFFLDPAERAACLAVNFDRSYKTAPDDIRATMPAKYANLIQLAQIESKEVHDLIKEYGGGEIGRDVDQGWIRDLYKTSSK